MYYFYICELSAFEDCDSQSQSGPHHFKYV